MSDRYKTDPTRADNFSNAPDRCSTARVVWCGTLSEPGAPAHGGWTVALGDIRILGRRSHRQCPRPRSQNCRRGPQLVSRWCALAFRSETIRVRGRSDRSPRVFRAGLRAIERGSSSRATGTMFPFHPDLVVVETFRARPAWREIIVVRTTRIDPREPREDRTRCSCRRSGGAAPTGFTDDAPRCRADTRLSGT